MKKRLFGLVMTLVLAIGCVAGVATALADTAASGLSFTFYSATGSGATYTGGVITTTADCEQKIMVNGISSETLDVSFTLAPKTASGLINGGLYVLAQNASAGQDAIDALNVNVERGEGSDRYSVSVFNFEQAFLGRIANTIPLAYNGPVRMRVIVDRDELLVYLDGSDVPSIQRKLKNLSKTGLEVGFRSQFCEMMFSDITVSTEPQKPTVPTVKVLMIGNSYAQDTMTYAHEIARADGVNLVCGVLYYGGCTVKKHVENIKANTTVYKYFKNGGTDAESINFYDVLYDEEWDYITIQTGSGEQGQKHTFYPYLPWLIAHVEHLVPRAEIGLFQSWAVPSCYEGTNNSRLRAYDDNSEKMYAAILSTFADLQKENGVRFVVPSAEAFHRMNETDVCDNSSQDTSYFRDSTAHADESGRYMLGLTIYRSITGRSVKGNAYVPYGMTYGSDRAPAAAERGVIQTVVEGLTDEYEILDSVATARVLTGVSVRNARLLYKAGQFFDYAAMEVYATYSDGTEERVENFTGSILRRLTTQDTSIDIGYRGFTATLELTVMA